MHTLIVMHGKYLVFPGEITFLNIFSYQMESNKVGYFLPCHLQFILIGYYWNLKDRVMDVT